MTTVTQGKTVTLPLTEYEDLLATIEERNKFIHEHTVNGKIQVEVLQPLSVFNQKHYSVRGRTYTDLEYKLMEIRHLDENISTEQLDSLQQDEYKVAVKDIYHCKRSLEKTLVELRGEQVNTHRELNYLKNMAFVARVWFAMTGCT